MDRISRYWVYDNDWSYDITLDMFTINHAGGYRTDALILYFDAFNLMAIL